jgi:hypothetical protein
MAEPIQRPSFFEGQILAPGDLSQDVDYGRGQRARHDRVLHEWGIADGLRLSSAGRTATDGTAYVEASLEPGLAIDGTGREIVVATTTLLDPNQFAQLDIATGHDGDWYPVLLSGIDAPLSLRSPLASVCGPLPPSRIAERFVVTFGKPGSEFSLVQQKRPAIAAGPGGALSDPPWRLLLGFVQWNATEGRFAAVADSANGVGRHYIGVRADEVAGQGPTLTLRAGIHPIANPVGPGSLQAAPEATLSNVAGLGTTLRLGIDLGLGLSAGLDLGSTGEIAAHEGSLNLRTQPRGTAGHVALNLTDGTGMKFGLQDAPGAINPAVFTVDDAGNVTIAGNVTVSGQLNATGAIASSSSITAAGPLKGSPVQQLGVIVGTGQTTSGMTIPLPPGVTPEQVASNQVRVNYFIVPRVPIPKINVDGLHLFFVDATVDGTGLVTCTIYETYSIAGVPQITTANGSADYLVVVTPVLS